MAAPNGLVANLYGSVEGKRHDSGMLADSALLNNLQIHSHSLNGIVHLRWYPLRQHLQAPFKGARLTPQQIAWNKSMSEVRVSVEWIFGDIVNSFKFLDFKKNLEIRLSAVDKMYIACALMQNARSCLYGSTTSEYFGVQPPQLDQYFI